MYRKIIINAAEHETRVALLEDGNIAELFVERGDFSDITGNIYKGRVQRVLPGMQAAFVDIGLKQAAFIYVRDIHGGRYGDIETLMTEGTEDENNSIHMNGDGPSPYFINQEYHIEDLITEGQDIMVQAAKAPMGSKGARVTTNISLPGRFIVLMPTSDHIGISRRIEDETKRNRLKEIVESLCKEKFGYIVRTAAEDIREEKIAYEMGFLKNLWENIQKKYQVSPAPALLHKEVAISLRAVRDLLVHEAEKLIIDSRSGYEAILSFLESFVPGLKDSVEFYEGLEPIFDAYNLEGDISRALKKKVWLKSGGYIVIEHTEALIAIDVNTGRFVGKYNLEETILKTNLEAVKEIAYQIRLRDIGGIIIIDFIDMEKKSWEKHLLYFATVGSNAPFLGLLGTVLGLMQAFSDLALAARPDAKAAMAGISNALITTVAGIVIAIPSVVIYNSLTKKVNRISTNIKALARTISANIF